MFIERAWIPSTCKERFLPSEPPLSTLLGQYGIAFGGLSRLSEGSYIERSQGAPFHVLLYTLEGCGSVEFENEILSTNPGDLLIIPAAKSAHRHRPKSPFWDIAWIRLDHSFRWHSLDSMECRVMPSKYSANVVHCLDEIIKESTNHNPERQQAVLSYAELLGLYIRRDMEASRDPQRERVSWCMDRLWNTVEEQLDRKWSVELLSAEAALSRTQLFRHCETLYGMTPLEKLLDLRIKRAKALLRNSDLSLAEIAEYIGYSSQFSFSTAFKRSAGISPKTFKRDN